MGCSYVCHQLCGQGWEGGNLWRRQTSCGTCLLHCRCDPREGHRYSWLREMVWECFYIDIFNYILTSHWVASGEVAGGLCQLELWRP